ncbi:hypothetical protein TNCV_3973361 [Trichonephila clavipes]|nr:hypothetical protein TNCV_3973361 [Trichonephila clavipes]
MTRIRPSWCHKLKLDSSEETTCCQSERQLLCTLAQCSRRRRWFCVRGILYKGILARSPRCSRRLRIDEAHNETRVAVDNCAASCLENAVRDEAHFSLNGYVNKQNCRIWSEANPQVYIETPLHPEKLTVWCALWAGGILLQKR